MSHPSSKRLPSPTRSYLGALFERPAGVAALALVLVLCSCTAGNPQLTASHPAGFFLGLWHGMIAWITLIVGLFDPGVQIYERNNTGGWYDFGFLIGVTGILGGGSRATQRRNGSAE